MAAMWPETEKLAEDGLVAFACTSYKPAVAPAGAIKPLFGTNPISFAWPRPGKTPVVYDMATASMAMGEVQVAKREGHKVPLGTGLTKEGYTFWEYMKGAWQKNNGMRIDHFLVSNSLINQIKSININKDPRGREKPSDHTPIEIKLA